MKLTVFQTFLEPFGIYLVLIRNYRKLNPLQVHFPKVLNRVLKTGFYFAVTEEQPFLQGLILTLTLATKGPSGSFFSEFCSMDSIRSIVHSFHTENSVECISSFHVSGVITDCYGCHWVKSFLLSLFLETCKILGLLNKGLITLPRPSQLGTHVKKETGEKNSGPKQKTTSFIFQNSYLGSN